MLLWSLQDICDRGVKTHVLFSRGVRTRPTLCFTQSSSSLESCYWRMISSWRCQKAWPRINHPPEGFKAISLNCDTSRERVRHLMEPTCRQKRRRTRNFICGPRLTWNFCLKLKTLSSEVLLPVNITEKIHTIFLGGEEQPWLIVFNCCIDVKRKVVVQRFPKTTGLIQSHFQHNRADTALKGATVH